MTSLWHPFADMATTAGNEIVLIHGEGVWVTDDQGNRYLDGASSLWYANVGHGRTEIRDAVAAQMAELETFHIFGDFANPPALALADRLAELSPLEDPKVLLNSGGGNSIETAMKLARLFHHVNGESQRRHLIHREHGYHGTHGIGTSILGMPYREEFGPLLSDTSQVAHDSIDALAAEIERIGPDQIAAFVFEPVIGSGGVYPPQPGYLVAAQELCRSHGILTIADVVIGGFGRLGTWFGVERFDLQPDLIVFAKGVTSGYLPLGGVVVSSSVAAPFWEQGATFMHGITYSGHATCCAAANANLDLLTRDGLVYRAAELEGWFHTALSTVADHPLVGEVRGGIGFMAAVELASDALAAHPHSAGLLWSEARAAGLLSRGLYTGIALAPPLTITESELEFAVNALRRGLDATARRLA